MINFANDKGAINISREVFTNIAGYAATNCFGVKGMAGRYKDGGPFQLLRRESMSKGVKAVLDGETGSVSIELHIVVDHGVNISALCDSIISEVKYKVEQATGVEIARVDIFVDSMVID